MNKQQFVEDYVLKHGGMLIVETAMYYGGTGINNKIINDKITIKGVGLKNVSSVNELVFYWTSLEGCYEKAYEFLKLNQLENGALK